MTKEGEGFQFDDWILQHNLLDIKHIFNKHNANTNSSLQFTSASFQSVITDQELLMKHAGKMSIIMAAVQYLSSQRGQNDYRSYIVVSEEEDIIMGKLKHNILTITNSEKEFELLRALFCQSVDQINKKKLNQIKKSKDKIIKIFDDIRQALDTKQYALIDILQELERREKCNCVDIYSVVINKSRSAKHSLSLALESCQDLIKLSNNNTAETRQKRKEKIINIGKKANEQFYTAQTELNQRKITIQTMIDENTKHDMMHIDFAVNDGTYQEIFDKIQKFGIVKKDKIDTKGQEDIVIQDSDKNVKELTQKIVELKQQLLKEKKKMDATNKKMADLTNECNRLKQMNTNMIIGNWKG